MSAFSDPFRHARRGPGVLQCPFAGEDILMLLRHGDVRAAAKDWMTYSSDAPFRVPIPSEESARSVRQLPIETDPPAHGEYRALVEPFFQRPKSPEMMTAVEGIIGAMVDRALVAGTMEVVHEFALPIQSRALACLLDVPAEEAEIWIGWGIHVLKLDDGGFKSSHPLEDYLNERFDRAEASPGKDFFSALATAEFRGRRLSREECLGFANLAFAGGRDTIIHTISLALAHLAEKPEALDWLKEDPKRIPLACEEFFRVFMPLTQIGRVCPAGAEVHGYAVKPGQRVGLCWASANFDESVFPEPGEVRLDRKPNPHLSFGAGHHLCLGIHHARLVLRSLLRLCVSRVGSLEVLEARARSENEHHFTRVLGYESLRMKFLPPV